MITGKGSYSIVAVGAASISDLSERQQAEGRTLYFHHLYLIWYPVAGWATEVSSNLLNSRVYLPPSWMTGCWSFMLCQILRLYQGKVIRYD